jgi:3-oxoacyl-[acyl-carrier protein] reductase
MSLEGRVILITGAAQGIGRATAELARSLGGRIVAVDRNAEAVSALAATDPDGYLAVAGDVTDPNFVSRMVSMAVDRFGAVHGLVNNAGITRPAMIKNMSLEDWNSVIHVNQTAAFLCLQAVGRQMLVQAEAGIHKPGAIVNVSSNAGRKGSIGQINYSAAKSALLGMTLSATNEWAQYGIRTNSVCFGLIETAMTETVRSDKFRDKVVAKIPMGRWGDTYEAACAICFLLSDAASFITGQQLSIDGGAFLSV